MTRVAVVAAGVAAGLVAVGSASHLASPPLAVTVRVAVERPATPAAPAGRPELWALHPGLVADWTIERGLGVTDFEVLSDNRDVPVLACVPVTGPAAVVVLIDASASMGTSPFSIPGTLPPAEMIAMVRPRATVGRVLEAMESSLIPALGPDVGAAFGRIAGTVEFTELLRRDRADLKKAARVLLKPTTGDVTKPFGVGPSPIWDAVDGAVALLGSAVGRKTIILLTDGRASANATSVAGAVSRALEERVVVHVVSDALDLELRQSANTAARVRPDRLLEELASATGGALLPAYGPRPVNAWLRTAEDCRRWLGFVLARMVQEERCSYALTFEAPADDGHSHRLSVRTTRPGLKVRAPAGYRVQAEGRR